MRKIIFLLVLITVMSLSGSVKLTDTHPFETYDDNFWYEPVGVDSTNLDTLVDFSKYIDNSPRLFQHLDLTSTIHIGDKYEIEYSPKGDTIKINGVLYEEPNQDTNSDIDDIIQYYGLYKQIEGLGARIDTLEQKIEVLEKAVEYEIFEQPKHDPNITYPIFNPLRDEFWEWKKIYGMRFNMPIVDPEWERFMKWKKRQLNPEKVTVDTVLTVDEMICDSLGCFGIITVDSLRVPYMINDATIDELRDTWEAIDKIIRRLK